MIDLEKVIKGLEHCANEADCRGCVYQEQMKGRSDECDCTGEALALLKEQEEQIERLEHDLAVAQNNLEDFAQFLISRAREDKLIVSVELSENSCKMSVEPLENRVYLCPHYGETREGR